MELLDGQRESASSDLGGYSLCCRYHPGTPDRSFTSAALCLRRTDLARRVAPTPGPRRNGAPDHLLRMAQFGHGSLANFTSRPEGQIRRPIRIRYNCRYFGRGAVRAPDGSTTKV